MHNVSSSEIKNFSIEVTHNTSKLTIQYDAKSKKISILNNKDNEFFNFKRSIEDLKNNDKLQVWIDVVNCLNECMEIIGDLEYIGVNYKIKL